MYIITGGGSGIGKALAQALAKRDKSVLIIGRREQLLRATAENSSLIQYLCADVAHKEGLDTIRNYLEPISQINALINNAGTIAPIAALKDIQDKEWHSTINTNLNAPLFLSQILWNKLDQGRVLNIGSGAAYFAAKGWAAYCVSKAALSMLTRCCQLESDTIAFASIMPGIIDTEMQDIARNSANMDLEQVKFYRRLKEDNRLISPETVAEFIAWLLLDIDRATFISKEWDIYDTTHHHLWLKAPHQVQHWDY